MVGRCFGKLTGPTLQRSPSENNDSVPAQTDDAIALVEVAVFARYADWLWRRATAPPRPIGCAISLIRRLERSPLLPLGSPQARLRPGPTGHRLAADAGAEAGSAQALPLDDGSLPARNRATRNDRPSSDRGPPRAAGGRTCPTAARSAGGPWRRIPRLARAGGGGVGPGAFALVSAIRLRAR